jgi:hypothetical protein
MFCLVYILAEVLITLMFVSMATDYDTEPLLMACCAGISALALFLSLLVRSAFEEYISETTFHFKKSRHEPHITAQYTMMPRLDANDLMRSLRD